MIQVNNRRILKLNLKLTRKRKMFKIAAVIVNHQILQKIKVIKIKKGILTFLTQGKNYRLNKLNKALKIN